MVANYINALKKDKKYSKSYQNKKRRDCLFKLSYIDLEHQLLGEVSTAQKRIEMGMLLAKRKPVKNVDYIVPIPETSIFNAQGFSSQSKIPLVNAIFKKRPKTQTLFVKNRKEKIKKIFLFIPNLIRNKKIVLVDETVISGLSLKTVLDIIKGFKPKEVHIRVVCKPMTRICPKNDFSKEWTFAPKDYKKYFKVKSFDYLEPYDLEKFAKCTYCFGGYKDNSIKFGDDEKKRY